MASPRSRVSVPRPGGTRFRTSFTHTEGLTPAYLVEGRIVNVNLVNYTVDVVSVFDRLIYTDIQVGSPYLHYSRGEGITVVPEVGAKCKVCLPSDSTPPYVQSFVMPNESADVDDEGGAGKPNYAGGRPRLKPGDIMLRGRDGNYVILHRGGVLQIGANELAQRIYLPLGNVIMDVSQDYVHHNAGGTVTWGVHEGPEQEDVPAEFCQTFRVFANSKFADIRVKAGKVRDPVPLTWAGQQELEKAGIKDQIVYEVAVVRGGFNTETGALERSPEEAVLQFFFDQSGGAFLGTKGSLALKTAKRLHVQAESVHMDAAKEFVITAGAGFTVDTKGAAHIKGQVVRLGPGAKPVAVLGSIVQMTLPFTPVVGSPTPMILTGVVSANTSPTVFA